MPTMPGRSSGSASSSRMRCRPLPRQSGWTMTLSALAHERSVVVLTVPAVPQDKVGPQPLAVPCAKAEVVFEIALDIFQRIGHEQLRVRHHGPHLVLEPVDGLGLFARTLPERDRQRRRPAADLMKTKFHFCNPSQNKIILSLRFQYKCHFKECQFMLY